MLPGCCHFWRCFLTSATTVEWLGVTDRFVQSCAKRAHGWYRRHACILAAFILLVLWPYCLETRTRDYLNLVIAEVNQGVKCVESENIPCRQ